MLDENFFSKLKCMNKGWKIWHGKFIQHEVQFQINLAWNKKIIFFFFFVNQGILAES